MPSTTDYADRHRPISGIGRDGHRKTSAAATHRGFRVGLLGVLMGVLAVIAAGCGGSSSGSSSSAALASGSGGAQAQTDNVDVAFVRQMIPHHKLAVAMAQIAAKKASHPKLLTLAKSIVRDQNQEITEMTSIAASIGVKPGAASSSGMSTGGEASADAKTLGLSMSMMGMSMKTSALDGVKSFDRVFIDMMIPHHQGAIRMAEAEIAKGRDPELKKLAAAIVAAQTLEIRRMNGWRKSWYGKTSPAGGAPAGEAPA